MPILTILFIVIVVGLSVVTNIHPQQTTPPSPSSSPVLMGETDVAQSSPQVASPKPSTNPSLVPSPQSSPSSVKSGKSSVSIKIDSTLRGSPETIIYPGASNTGGNSYQTSDSGDAVYSWYKSEIEKRGYNIRNNVKTRSNELFEAQITGESKDHSIKVIINQENAGAKTLITLN